MEAEVISESTGLVPEVDPLAKFRAEVAAEKEAKPSAMSDRSAERLRQINYEDRVAKQNEEKFAYALTQVEVTPDTLSKLIERCSGKSSDLERRTSKLLFWIQSRGWRLGREIKAPHDISFLSEVTSDEIAMSDSTFAATWRVKKIVAPISDGPKMEDCRAGKECKWLKNRRPRQAPAGQFCTPICRQSFLAVQKRAKAGVRSVVN